MEIGKVLIGLLALFVAGLVYFLPTIVAAKRRHHNYTAIFMLNLLTGWTFIGWAAALIWSFTNPPRR